MTTPTLRPTAKGLLTALVGLTLLATPACKGKKEEPAATPSQATQAAAPDHAPAASTAPADHAPAASTAPAETTQEAAASDAAPASLTTKGQRTASTSDAAAEKGVKAQKPPQPGLVWVNLKNGTYHTETSPHYGKTAQGKWMKESKAIARGYKPVGAKAATASDKAASASDAAHKPAAH